MIFRPRLLFLCGVGASPGRIQALVVLKGGTVGYREQRASCFEPDVDQYVLHSRCHYRNGSPVGRGLRVGASIVCVCA